MYLLRFAVVPRYIDDARSNMSDYGEVSVCEGTYRCNKATPLLAMMGRKLAFLLLFAVIFFIPSRLFIIVFKFDNTLL
jgi:hypothetical protein